MSFKLKVSDMACGACAESITKAVTALDEAATVDADLKTKWVSIKTQAEMAQVKAAIAAAGYTLTESPDGLS